MPSITLSEPWLNGLVVSCWQWYLPFVWIPGFQTKRGGRVIIGILFGYLTQEFVSIFPHHLRASTQAGSCCKVNHAVKWNAIYMFHCSIAFGICFFSIWDGWFCTRLAIQIAATARTPSEESSQEKRLALLFMLRTHLVELDLWHRWLQDVSSDVAPVAELLCSWNFILFAQGMEFQGNFLYHHIFMWCCLQETESSKSWFYILFSLFISTFKSKYMP